MLAGRSQTKYKYNDVQTDWRNQLAKEQGLKGL